MAQEYVVKFEMGEITGQTEEEYKKQKETNSEKSVDKKSDTAKTVSKVLTLASSAAAISTQVYQQIQSTNNAIRGDTIAQAHLDSRLAKVNEGLKVSTGLGIGALIGGVAGAGAVAGGLAISYGMKAFQLGQQNRQKQASWQIETLVNAETQRRLVQDISGVRK